MLERREMARLALCSIHRVMRIMSFMILILWMVLLGCVWGGRVVWDYDKDFSH